MYTVYRVIGAYITIGYRTWPESKHRFRVIRFTSFDGRNSKWVIKM